MMYNGWKNYETWNIALWLGNDEGLYNIAKEYRFYSRPYERLVAALREIGVDETPDGVAFDDTNLDVEALDEAIGEF